jgi:hypothetical protein
MARVNTNTPTVTAHLYIEASAREKADAAGYLRQVLRNQQARGFSRKSASKKIAGAAGYRAAPLLRSDASRPR